MDEADVGGRKGWDVQLGWGGGGGPGRGGRDPAIP